MLQITGTTTNQKIVGDLKIYLKYLDNLGT